MLYNEMIMKTISLRMQVHSETDIPITHRSTVVSINKLYRRYKQEHASS